MTSFTSITRNEIKIDPYVVKLHLINVFAELDGFFSELKTIDILKPSGRSTEEALVNITIGQMLSRKAASTIYERVVKLREQYGVEFSMELPDDMLLSCGISARKVKTIKSFHTYWRSNRSDIVDWAFIDYDELMKEIKKNIWGFADWSIAMLAIFHFAHSDVFPKNDGTLKRAVKLIEEKYEIEERLKVEKASPYSSYMALYMWHAIDSGYL